MTAENVRREWMELMGIDPEEIVEGTQVKPPTSVEWELEQLQAMREIKQMNRAVDA